MKIPRLACLWAVAALVIFPALLHAQERVITGTVTDAESGQPLVGVFVNVRGTSISAVTGDRGTFTIRVPQSATALTFSSLGYRTLESPIRADAAAQQINIQLERQAIGLEGIVVTALGVHRERASLGYALQEVSGEQLAQVPKTNLVNALQGLVAGVQVTDAGPQGGSARIVIRGASSIAGNNQPLFVVDGIPIDNSAPRNTGFGGLDYGNTVQDINPDNIESVSVLRGPNAAALYGSRAANGAIVITTKSGRGAGALGMGITASQSVTMESPLRLPNYQNLYGQGFAGQFRFVDGNGGGVFDHFDESWGPKLDGRLIDQFTGPQQPWVPQPNNVRDFFRTGVTTNTNIAVSRASESSNVRLSVNNMQLNGMAPGMRIDRVGVALRGGASLTSRLSTDASLNYTNQDGRKRMGTGYDENNPMQQFIWFGRQVDMKALSRFRCTGNEPTACSPGGQFNWNYNYHNNPYWEQHVNWNRDERDRVIGHVQTSYQLTDWLTAAGRIGRDWYREGRKDVIELQSLENSDGGFFDDTRYVAETNTDFLLTATRQLTSALGLNVTGGGNYRENSFSRSTLQVDALTAPGVFSIANAAKPAIPTDRRELKRVRSLYGSVSTNYNGYFNVDVTGRNDWSSTLPEENRSYFYPSVSTAFVFSDAFNLRSNLFSSGKVRASWTRVGNDTDPYQLASVYGAFVPFGGVPLFTVPDALPNINLKPEETTAWEFGTDLGFLDERLGFVLTYYDATTRNQILGVQISPTSGFTSQRLNAGEVRNYGIELLMSTTPVRMSRFRWDMTLNWARNNSQVRELYGDLETLVLGTYWSLNIEARAPERDENGKVTKYHPYGVMFGNGYLRDDDGRLLLTAAGVPRVDPVRRVLGRYTPDWNGGVQNRFSYGPVNLSVLVDGQRGGNVFSVTDWFGEYAGVLQSSIRGRENDAGPGVGPLRLPEQQASDTNQPIGCDPGIVVSGVLPDGRINGQDVTRAICPWTYFGRNFGIHESGIVDASYMKLREVRLGYEIPQGFMRRLGFSGGDVALVGRNLLLWAKTENIDPETAFDASNVQGIEFGQHPTARSLGITLSVRP